MNSSKRWVNTSLHCIIYSTGREKMSFILNQNMSFNRNKAKWFRIKSEACEWNQITELSKWVAWWLEHRLCRQWAVSWLLGFGTELLCWSEIGTLTLIHMDLKHRASYLGPSAAQCQNGGGLWESMTGAAQRKSVPETQTPVWTSVWVTGAGQELWEEPWQPSWSPWQPPIPKDSYWLAVTVPNATGASLRCQVFITRPSGRERKRMSKIHIHFFSFYFFFCSIL